MDAYDTDEITGKKKTFHRCSIQTSKIKRRKVTKDKNAVICGDFNNPSVNWSTLTADREGTRLLKLTDKAFLYQIVQTPTRGNNIFYLIFTNDSDIIHTCEVGEPLGTVITTSLESN